MKCIGAYLKQAQDEYRIVSKDLAALGKISSNHLSEIRNGKVWPSEEVFLNLLEAMHQLAPGSREYFCLLLAKKKSWSRDDSPLLRIEQALDELANEDEENMAMLLMVRRLRKTQAQVLEKVLR